MTEGFKTPLEQRLKNAEWRRNNRQKMSQYANAYGLRHPERRMWSVAKQRAKRKGLPFSITPEDIVIPESCPALGIALVSGIGSRGRFGGNPDSPSLDRIDPELGYVPGNVRVISNLANTMKGAATKQQLESFAKWVLSDG